MHAWKGRGTSTRPPTNARRATHACRSAHVEARRTHQQLLPVGAMQLAHGSSVAAHRRRPPLGPAYTCVRGFGQARAP
eukprot:363419-Chlamydomonas_euryale.AAC.1